MGHWTSFCLKFFLSTQILIKGTENVIKNEKFFIAASHQSMFETFFLQTIFNSPIFILKKELLSIPIFGWYLKKIGSISIKRDKITKDNLGFFDEISKIAVNSDRPLIIFPQGTRCKTRDRPNFKKGVERIYKLKNIKCQPVVMNSGDVWPKLGNLSSNRKIIVSVLPSIEPNLPDKHFVETLQSKMYAELDKIL